MKNRTILRTLMIIKFLRNGNQKKIFWNEKKTILINTLKDIYK
jgi:hypothetical protein